MKWRWTALEGTQGEPLLKKQYWGPTQEKRKQIASIPAQINISFASWPIMKHVIYPMPMIQVLLFHSRWKSSVIWSNYLKSDHLFHIFTHLRSILWDNFLANHTLSLFSNTQVLLAFIPSDDLLPLLCCFSTSMNLETHPLEAKSYWISLHRSSLESEVWSHNKTCNPPPTPPRFL